MNTRPALYLLDAIDRRIVAATQRGLPLAERPFDVLAETLQLPLPAIRERLGRMMASGVVRRIAAVPNHYALGYLANGMSVWDVEDDALPELGLRIGALDFVSHCYRRPRIPPSWNYNLFAMVHGRTRAEVAGHVAEIARLLGCACSAHDVLYSTRILKKTGMRISGASACSE